MTKPVLMILHRETSNPGRLAPLLTARGHGLDIRRVACGDPLPEETNAYAGVVIYGGPMSVNDDLDFIHQEIDFVGKLLRNETPFLGICLGAQMLAKQLGGQVYPHHRGDVEIGYYPIRATAEGAAHFPERLHVYQWHTEGFDLPNGAVALAEGERFPVQAMRVGPSAYGVQFHPELTWKMMRLWTHHGRARLALPNARPRHTHFIDRFRHDLAVRQWLNGFLDRWLSEEEPLPEASPEFLDPLPYRT